MEEANNDLLDANGNTLDQIGHMYVYPNSTGDPSKDSLVMVDKIEKITNNKHGEEPSFLVSYHTKK